MSNPNIAGSAHTPGPWRISVDDLGYATIRTGERNSSPDSDLIAEVFGDAGNADLIAAAPELLEAAKEALRALVGIDSMLHLSGLMVGVDCPAIGLLRAAIAKATGAA